MYALGLAPGQRDYETGVVDELLLQICPWYTNDYWPLDRFLYTCASAVHFPEKEKDQYQRGRHKLCGELSTKINEMDPTKPGRANWLFCCGKLKAAETIMDGENSYAWVRGQERKSHRFLCKEWLKKREPALKIIKDASQINW